MNAYENLITEIDSNILTITLNRPEYLNALNAHLLEELADVFNHASINPEIKGLLIKGTDKAFCAGADIQQLMNLNAESGVDFAHKGQQVFQLLEKAGKPSIAIIDGFALGGGCELAIAATLRICSEKAVFGQPEVKLGVIPGYGGTQRLSRLIGKGKALEICITGRMVKAEEALAIGLVNECVKSENLLHRAREILQTIFAMAPLAVRSAIEVIQAGYDLPLEEALNLEAAHFGLLCATKDKREGVEAFLDKRNPYFNGR